MTSIIISNDSLADTKKIYARNIVVGGTKNSSMKPTPSSDTIVDVHTQSFENPTISISGINFIDNTDSITMEDVLILYKQKYDGTNYSTLTVTYGEDSVIPNISAETTGIKVILKNFNITFDTSNTKNSYIPSGTLNFVETK